MAARASRGFRSAKWAALLTGGGAAAGYTAMCAYKMFDASRVHANLVVSREKPPGYLPYIPQREDMLKEMKSGAIYDVLVIGGGATGTGVALDAQTRGLKTALIEYDDFSSGTSSRSTKLIHGGVRYLQKAIMGFDVEQYRMVKEALVERKNLIDIAPHLAYPFPIMLPVYTWWQIPYFWVGIKAYDFVAGSKCLLSSYFLHKERTLELFPMLKKDKLCGSIVYYDGQHNDSRMNVVLGVTAARAGAHVANHVECTGLVKTGGESPETTTTGENGDVVVRNQSAPRICGARVRDRITGEEFTINAKCVINATGPFCDSIRQMDDPQARTLVIPSVGIHVVLPDYYSPANMGLLDPATSDGRVIFFLPWEGATIAGTTDSPSPVTHNPQPNEKDIQFILAEIRHYLDESVNVRRGDVRSAWAGLRPLVRDPHAKSTQAIARNHIIHISDSKLITVAGGKWTTYRAMAEETMNKAIEDLGLHPGRECQTLGLMLEGGHDWTPTTYIRLAQDFGMETDVAQHLAHTYGDRALKVARLAKLTGLKYPVVGIRLHRDYPYIEAEVLYGIKEYARTATDVIARRLRIAFINYQAAEEMLPRVCDIMAEELKWSGAEKKRQHEEALEFLRNEMGGAVAKESRMNVPIDLTKKEIDFYVQHFTKLDTTHKGYITVNDFKPWLRKQGHHMTDKQIHEILTEVDLNKNGQIDLSEYLQLMSAIKSGNVAVTRFALAAQAEGSAGSPYSTAGDVPVARSGGGV